MKTLRMALVALLIAFTSIFATSFANAGELEVLGAKLSWSDTMYKAEAVCGNYAFNYVNGSGVQLMQLGYILSDPYGRIVSQNSEVGIKPNISGTWNQQICRSQFTNGVGPYSIKLFAKDLASTQREATRDIYFLDLPTATPTPTPTVTVTATPAPAPTVTVTAKPSPAPTVTVTATPAPAPTTFPDKKLTALVTSLNSQIKLLTAKVKKICVVKPKPKGC